MNARPHPGMITETARAKVNLCLHVTGQRADGYHELDSLVAFADVGDVVHLRPADRLDLTVSGPFAKDVPTDDDNLVLRAARMVGANAQITLVKNLPVASGIGGGSADAAACLRGLQKLGHDAPRPGDLLSLGADVPVCYQNRATRMQGIGDKLVPTPLPRRLIAVLANPRIAISTPRVFAALEHRDNGPLTWPVGHHLLEWIRQQRNDLEPAAIKLAPQIGDVLEELTKHGAQLARMSGSGATCFGLFDTLETAQRASDALQRRGWWSVTSQIA